MNVPQIDDWYYLKDGNTTFQVCSVLFKVHRSILAKDESTFENMFALNTEKGDASEPDEALDGSSDERPIHLQGDTPDEFRALLWSLYALYAVYNPHPNEIALAMTPQGADEAKLIKLARISHKYHFTTTESWALQTLTSYLTFPSDSQFQEAGDQDSTKNLEEITKLAVLCDYRPLLDIAIAKWKRLVGEGQHVSAAMCISDNLAIREIRGISYHSMMLRGKEAWNTDALLSREQRIRLLSGHYTLSKLCEDLPDSPPSLHHNPACSSIPPCLSRCTSGWRQLWKAVNSPSREGGLGSQVISLQSVDMLGKAMLAESVMKALVDGEIPDGGMLGYMHPQCHRSALVATQSMLERVRLESADWFADVV